MSFDEAAQRITVQRMPTRRTAARSLARRNSRSRADWRRSDQCGRRGHHDGCGHGRAIETPAATGRTF